MAALLLEGLIPPRTTTTKMNMYEIQTLIRTIMCCKLEVSCYLFLMRFTEDTTSCILDVECCWIHCSASSIMFEIPGNRSVFGFSSSWVTILSFYFSLPLQVDVYLTSPLRISFTVESKYTHFLFDSLLLPTRVYTTFVHEN